MIRWPAPAAPRPDFLRPARRPGRLAWAACTTACLVLAVAAIDAHSAWMARAQANARWSQSQQRLAAQRQATVAGGADQPALPARAADDRRLADARQWLQRLARPWPGVWAASELAGGDGIAWLGLALSERGQLRLDGLAPDARLALDAAQALRLQHHAGAALWRDVVVARIDRAPDGHRFEISAQLAGPAP